MRYHKRPPPMSEVWELRSVDFERDADGRPVWTVVLGFWSRYMGKHKRIELRLGHGQTVAQVKIDLEVLLGDLSRVPEAVKLVESKPHIVENLPWWRERERARLKAKAEKS